MGDDELTHKHAHIDSLTAFRYAFRYLHYNQITDIEEGAFGAMPNLTNMYGR